LAAAPGRVLLAQTPPASDRLASRPACFGQKIGAIEIPNANAADQQMLENLTGLRVGEPLDRTALQQALRSLYATGRYSDVKAECEPGADGTVSVKFTNHPNFFVGRVSVENAPSPPGDAQIVNASKLQLGELFIPERLDRALQNIQHLLQQNGYY